ncbi:hypothetical protein PROFUN_12386, partial [Planoprotostelium fungivorum]
EEIYQVLFSMIRELEQTKREEGADRSTVELAQDVVKEYRGILNCLPGDYIDHNPYHQISQMLDQMIQQPTTESHQRIKSYIGTERKSQATKEAREEVEMDIKDKLSELKRMAETVEGREGGNQRSDQRREGEKIMEWINRGRATMSSGGVTISTYIPIPVSSLIDLDDILQDLYRLCSVNQPRDDPLSPLIVLIQDLLSQCKQLVSLDWTEDDSPSPLSPKGSRLLVCFVHYADFLPIQMLTRLSQTINFYHKTMKNPDHGSDSRSQNLKYMKVMEGIINYEHDRMYSKTVTETIQELAPLVLQWESCISETSIEGLRILFCLFNLIQSSKEMHQLNKGLQTLIQTKKQKLAHYNELQQKAHLALEERETNEEQQMEHALDVHSVSKSLLNDREKYLSHLNLLLETISDCSIEPESIESNAKQKRINASRDDVSSFYSQLFNLTVLSTKLTEQLHSGDDLMSQNKHKDNSDVNLTGDGEEIQAEMQGGKLDGLSFEDMYKTYDLSSSIHQDPTRNMHAIKVLKKVANKLDGKEDGGSTTISEEDQLGYKISPGLLVSQLMSLLNKQP